MRARILSLIICGLGTGVVAQGGAAAAVLCAKGSGPVMVRDSSCKRRETALDLAQLGAADAGGPPGAAGPGGPAGPAGAGGPRPGGPAGPAVTARAYAWVSSAGVLDPVRTKNVASVSNPYPGLFCLTLADAAGISARAAAPQVTIDLSNSPDDKMLAYLGLNPAYCGGDAGPIAVLTASLYSGAISYTNEAFTILIP